MNEIQNLIYYGWLYKVPVQTVMHELASVQAHISKVQVLEIWLIYDQGGRHHVPVEAVVREACCPA